MVRYARDKGLKVIFFTNGIILDREKARKIIDLEISEIFCSLPAGTDKTYALVNSACSKDAFRRIVSNLKNLILMREASGKKWPLLQMTHVIHKLNYNDLEDMARLDAYIGADKVRFYLVRLDKNIKFLKMNSSHIETIKRSLIIIGPYLKSKNIELQDNIYFQLKNYNPLTGYWSEKEFLKSGCPVGWFFCLILAKSEVSMCCHLRIVDYLKEKPFSEVWNSEDYNNLRIQAKYLMKNKHVSVPNGLKLYDDFCKHCDTHQVIFMISQLMKKYNLSRFL
jgi:MoaA/NifB/PqqE/SkfB family radical SAM enzyme